MLITDFEKNLINQFDKIVQEQFNIEVDISVQKPKNNENGTFTTNVAMQVKSKLNKNPREIATTICENFLKDEFIEKIEVAGPGFINIYTTAEYSNSILDSIDDQYGQLSTDNKEKYLVEFVSANPTGDLHLGHARGGIYGDSLVRIMAKAGYDVTSEYYLNDAGNQMQNLGLSTKYFYFQLLGEELEFPTDGYRGNDIIAIAQSIFEQYGDQQKTADLQFFIDYGYQHNLIEIKKILAAIDVSFDNFVSERELYSSGKVESVLNVLQTSGDLYDKDGATWLATSKYLDDKDRTIKKSDGTFTYFAADIAYHLDKYNRGYDHLIDVWGADHHGYVPRVRSSIQSLGKNPDSFEVPIVQMVSILNNNEKVKMSKRAGTSVTIKDLLEMIDKDVLRYFFLMRSLDTQLDFDIKFATEQSMDNPIFYIQYANARISSVLADCKTRNLNVGDKLSIITSLESEIINQLSIYPKVISEAAEKRLPHLVCNYLYDTASLFHKYYNQERVFTDDVENTQNKQLVYTKIQHVLVSGLDLLGIVAKNEM